MDLKGPSTPSDPVTLTAKMSSRHSAIKKIKGTTHKNDDDGDSVAPLGWISNSFVAFHAALNADEM